MEAQSLILGVVIVALTALIVLWPLVSGAGKEKRESAPSTALETLLAERDAIYTVIRDLDFDFETGKLTEADYQAQREQWVERGVDVLKALDAAQVNGAAAAPANGTAATPAEPDDLESQIEAAIAARRRAAE